MFLSSDISSVFIVLPDQLVSVDQSKRRSCPLYNQSIGPFRHPFCMDPLNFQLLISINILILSIFCQLTMTNSKKEKVPAERNPMEIDDPSHVRGAGANDQSAAISKAHLLAERKFLSEFGQQLFLGRSFDRHEIPRLLLEVLGRGSSDDEWSFDAFLDDYKQHGARMVDTPNQENHKHSYESTGHDDHLVNEMKLAENEVLDFKKCSPTDVGNPGARYLKYLWTEFLRGTPSGPLHCCALVLNWLKFNNYEPGQVCVGGYLAKDLLSLLKVCLNVNQVNVKLAQVECEPHHGGRRPTEKEVKELILKLLQRVSYNHFPKF